MQASQTNSYKQMVFYVILEDLDSFIGRKKKDEELVRCIDGQINRWLDVFMDRWIYRQIERYIDRQIDRQIDRKFSS